MHQLRIQTEKAICDQTDQLKSECVTYAWKSLLQFAGLVIDATHQTVQATDNHLGLVYNAIGVGADNESSIIIRPASATRFFQLIRDQKSGSVSEWNHDRACRKREDIKYFPHTLIPESNLCPAAFINERGNKILIDCDIILRSFAMLSRLEECLDLRRDRFDRFVASQSCAARYGFLQEPIIDHYADCLRKCVGHVFPTSQANTNTGQVQYTCDVDVPHDPIIDSRRELVLRLGADFVLRRKPKIALTRLKNRKRARFGDFSSDPNRRFDWIMTLCEENNLCGTFFFLASNQRGHGCGTYRIQDTSIRSLIQEIEGRGHHIGLHGSFGTYRDPEQIKRELWNLESSGIRLDCVRNRQHYLQWDARLTPDALEAAGVDEDWSGGFHDAPGFRFGTSHPFSMWSWSKMSPLKLKQVPLIMMESSLLDPRYQALSHFPDAYHLALRLKQSALSAGGNFTLLWHNSYLHREADRNLFSKIITKTPS